jgi:hypothetical protein
VSVCRERIGNLQLELECCHNTPNLQFYASQTVVFLRHVAPRLARGFILTSVGLLQGQSLSSVLKNLTSHF